MGKTVITQWSARSSGRPITVWPDGCRDLIVRHDPLYGSVVFLTALDSTAYEVAATEGTVFWGLRLAPGTLASWEDDAREAHGRVTDVRRCGDAPREFARLVSRRPERAEDLLAEVAHGWFRPADGLAADFVAHGHDWSCCTVSGRTARRRIGNATGAPPRFWFGLRRVRLAASAIVLGSDPLAEVAVAHGFSDQAHLTRETARWLGATPAALRRERRRFQGLVSMPTAFDAAI